MSDLFSLATLQRSDVFSAKMSDPTVTRLALQRGLLNNASDINATQPHEFVFTEELRR